MTLKSEYIGWQDSNHSLRVRFLATQALVPVASINYQRVVGLNPDAAKGFFAKPCLKLTYHAVEIVHSLSIK